MRVVLLALVDRVGVLVVGVFIALVLRGRPPEFLLQALGRLLRRLHGQFLGGGPSHGRAVEGDNHVLYLRGLLLRRLDDVVLIGRGLGVRVHCRDPLLALGLGVALPHGVRDLLALEVCPWECVARAVHAPAALQERVKPSRLHVDEGRPQEGPGLALPI